MLLSKRIAFFKLTGVSHNLYLAYSHLGRLAIHNDINATQMQNIVFHGKGKVDDCFSISYFSTFMYTHLFHIFH